jgi:hypothetical protein
MEQNPEEELLCARAVVCANDVNMDCQISKQHCPMNLFSHVT